MNKPPWLRIIHHCPPSDPQADKTMGVLPFFRKGNKAQGVDRVRVKAPPPPSCCRIRSSTKELPVLPASAGTARLPTHRPHTGSARRRTRGIPPEASRPRPAPPGKAKNASSVIPQVGPPPAKLFVIQAVEHGLVVKQLDISRVIHRPAIPVVDPARNDRFTLRRRHFIKPESLITTYPARYFIPQYVISSGPTATRFPVCLPDPAGGAASPRCPSVSPAPSNT